MSSFVHNTLAQQCPLCGEPNACAQEKARATGRPAEVCWCFDQSISTAALEKVPESSRGQQCICQRCAGAPNGTPAAA